MSLLFMIFFKAFLSRKQKVPKMAFLEPFVVEVLRKTREQLFFRVVVERFKPRNHIEQFLIDTGLP